MKKRYVKKTLLMFSLLVFQYHTIACAQQRIENINWITENHPPQNYMINNQATGISVDILLAIWSKLGVYKKREHIKIFPWARGYLMLEKNHNTCLFAMGMTKERKMKFKFVGPYMNHIIGIIVKKSKAIKVENYQGLINHKSVVRIGSVRDDIGAELLLNKGYPQKKLHLVNSTKNLIKMLAIDRIPAICLGFDAALWEMKLQNMDTSKYELIFPLKTVGTGFGFNTAVDPGLICAMQSALDELKYEGRVAFIIEKHRH